MRNKQRIEDLKRQVSMLEEHNRRLEAMCSKAAFRVESAYHVLNDEQLQKIRDGSSTVWAQKLAIEVLGRRYKHKDDPEG